MPIEISEYRRDTETQEEQFNPLRIISDDIRAMHFNTQELTGVDETLTVVPPGHIIRGNGQELALDDPGIPQLVMPLNNMVRIRELFISGSNGRVLCIRRISETTRENRNDTV